MRRYFNTEGACSPKRHYMVRLDERLKTIRERYVDGGSYFVINRGRQYGKTTTLKALAEYLKDEYLVLAMDFQKLDTDEFINSSAFSRAFAGMCARAFENVEIENRDELIKPIFFLAEEAGNVTMNSLFIQLSILCGKTSKPVVLIIDEVDSASNNQVFLDFLAMLRGYYLSRDEQPTFHSVILAGVYDIKNLKLKLRPDSEHQYNSPWNIAAEFDIDMSFSARQIAGMLAEYEADRQTGMDVAAVAGEIYDYTSGYPYLVSAICKFLDESPKTGGEAGELSDTWTREGIAWAVKFLLGKSLPIFQSMMRQLAEYSEMRQMLRAILFQGKRIAYNPDNPTIQLAAMFGYIVNREGSIQVANRIFETRLYNNFLSEADMTDSLYDEAQANQSRFIKNGRLDMALVLEKFTVHFTDIYGGSDEKFLEDNGRRFFLLYLKPIINGVGNYYIEAQTRDARRTDVVVDYRGEQFVVELKIWRGNEYNERGEAQLAEYLEYFHLDKGYMLSFCFNRKKEIGVKELQVGAKTIVEAVV